MSDETEITRFTADDAVEALRDKIKLEFANAIPDAQWEAMIRAEFTRFTEPFPGTKDQWGNVRGAHEAGITTVAQQVIREITVAKFKEHLGAQEVSAKWMELLMAEIKLQLPGVLEQLVRRALSKAVERVGEDLASQIADRFRFQSP